MTYDYICLVTFYFTINRSGAHDFFSFLQLIKTRKIRSSFCSYARTIVSVAQQYIQHLSLSIVLFSQPYMPLRSYIFSERKRHF